MRGSWGWASRSRSERGAGTGNQRGGVARHYVTGVGGRLNVAERELQVGMSKDPLPQDDFVWPEERAYWHTVVTGIDGFVVNRLPQVENEEDNVRWVCRDQPWDWFSHNQKQRKTWRLAIYAHGGLNSEGNSIERIRMLGPCFLKNGIYPVFVTWKSGWLETLANMVQDGVKSWFGDRLFPERGLTEALTERTDRALEIFVRNVLGKSMWTEMKENVTRSAGSSRGIGLLARFVSELATKASQQDKNLEIHLVGHSAGAFVLGRTLTDLVRRRRDVKTCTLFAPACDLDFALEHYGGAIGKDRLDAKNFHLYTLTDELERDDSVGPYRKSLLYLISRALERRHKTPLLGLASSYDADRATTQYWHKEAVASVKQWQNDFWESPVPMKFAKSGNLPASAKAKGGNLNLWQKDMVNTGARPIKSTHGSFDNNLTVITETLQRILGSSQMKFKPRHLDY